MFQSLANKYIVNGIFLLKLNFRFFYEMAYLYVYKFTVSSINQVDSSVGPCNLHTKYLKKGEFKKIKITSCSFTLMVKRNVINFRFERRGYYKQHHKIVSFGDFYYQK